MRVLLVRVLAGCIDAVTGDAVLDLSF